MRRAPMRPNPAVAEMLDAHGVTDALLAGRGLRFDSSPPVQQTAPQPFAPPPPDWSSEARAERGDDVQAEPGLGLSAVERMMQDADARGELPDRLIPGPPIQYERLQRFVPPEPDWRAEERERERQRTAEVSAELDAGEALGAYPARPKRRR